MSPFSRWSESFSHHLVMLSITAALLRIIRDWGWNRSIQNKYLWCWASRTDTDLISVQLLCCKDGLFIPHVWRRRAQRPSLLQRHMSFSGLWTCQVWNTGTEAARSQAGDQVSGLPQGALVPVIMAFSPLWLAAPLTMDEGCRPASCQAVSTPFSAAVWPTPQVTARVTRFRKTRFCCRWKTACLMPVKFCFSGLFDTQSGSRLCNQAKTGLKWNSFNSYMKYVHYKQGWTFVWHSRFMIYGAFSWRVLKWIDANVIYLQIYLITKDGLTSNSCVILEKQEDADRHVRKLKNPHTIMWAFKFKYLSLSFSCLDLY